MTDGAGPEVITLGETLVSFAAAPGPLFLARTVGKSIAGAETNVAIGLSRLGVRVGAVTRVGDDPFGQEIVRTLRAEGVDVSAVVVDPVLPTGLMVKERPTAETANVWYRRAGSAATALSSDDVDRAFDALPTPPRHVHVSGITLALGNGPRTAVGRLLELAAAVGASASLDTNHRRRLWDDETFAATCRPLCGVVQELMCSGDEALVLTGRRTDLPAAVRDGAVTQALDELAADGADRVVVRLGPAGSVGRGADGVHHRVAAVTAGPVVDVVGAGDAYTAGYLADVLAGGDLPSAMAIGAWAAGWVVATEGDWEGLPGAAALAVHRSGVAGVDR